MSFFTAFWSAHSAAFCSSKCTALFETLGSALDDPDAAAKWATFYSTDTKTYRSAHAEAHSSADWATLETANNAALASAVKTAHWTTHRPA
jgi:hypothetical protein